MNNSQLPTRLVPCLEQNNSYCTDTHLHKHGYPLNGYKLYIYLSALLSVFYNIVLKYIRSRRKSGSSRMVAAFTVYDTVQCKMQSFSGDKVLTICTGSLTTQLELANLYKLQTSLHNTRGKASHMLTVCLTS